ncbi:MAG TPA: TolC family protein [Opitutaceae bacterium]
MKLRSFSVLLLALAGSTFASAQGAPAVAPLPAQLDLRAAINYAVEHNYSILQARERIREQEGLIVEVKALALPNAAVNSSYTRTDSGLLQDRGVGASEDDWRIALEVRQALYAGGGVKAALDAQRLVRESSLLELQSVINDALLQVRTRFYDVLLAREQITVQEENVRLLTEQLQTARDRFEAGSVSNFDVLRAEVALANARTPLIRVRNQYRIAIDQLRQALGYGEPTTGSSPSMPEVVGELAFAPASYELESALSSARINRPDLLRLAKVEEARRAGVTIREANYRPTLDVVGGYQFRKSANSERLKDSLDGWTLGLQSSWAVFDGRRTKGQVVQARSQLEQARLQTAERTLGVEVEVRQALSALQEAAELVESARRVVEQAEEAVRLADARYGAGTVTQLEVLQARVALTEARTNQLQANYSHNVALATVRRAIGQSDAFLAP